MTGSDAVSQSLLFVEHLLSIYYDGERQRNYPEMNFKVALLQIAPSENDQNVNLAKALQYCRDAKSAGADLAVLPELWNIGCAPCPIDEAGRRSWTAAAINQQSDFFQKFVTLARELTMSIAVTYLELHRPKPRNTVSIINSGGKSCLIIRKCFSAILEQKNF